MEQEVIFRTLMGVLFAGFIIVRGYHHRCALKDGGKIEYHEPRGVLMRMLRLSGGMVLAGALLLFFFLPDWLAWATVPFPSWLRWAGFGLGITATMATWWTEASLGLNFNVTLHLREGHTLVMHGPYRWVRHPMYTSLLGVTISWLLVSSNWLVGLPGIVGLLTIIVNRVDAEEKMMIETFGEKYRAYLRRTGRFLPGL